MELERAVRGVGPTHAGVLCILGEAPGSEEVEKGVPFVGPAGRILRARLAAAGLQDSAIRIENVIERKLKDNDLSPLYLDKQRIYPGDELNAWFTDCRKRLASLQPSVIVAAGETALQATTGRKGITRCHCTPVPGVAELTGIPILPVYHPAYILRQMEESPWLLFGLRKAKRIAAGAHDRERHLIIRPTLAEVSSFLDLAEARGTPVAIDIECDRKTHEILCLAIATDADRALCIPLSVPGGSYWSDPEEKQVWLLLARFLHSSSNPKIFQNFIYDTLMLSRFGLEVAGGVDDTMLIAGVLHPEIGKGLADLARLYTYAPAWKGERDWSISSVNDDLWTYNATDAAITLEVYEAQQIELSTRGLAEVHRQRIRPLIPLVYELCARGFRVDPDRLGAKSAEMSARLEALNERIREIVGEEFNPRSPKQIKEMLARRGINTPWRAGKETTDRKALLQLARRYPDEAIFPLLLEHSKVAKLKSTYCDMQLDPDGRLRFSINIAGTKSGRFSSSETPWETGTNSQNIPSRDASSPYNFRPIIIPDPGKILLQVDLKNAEARVAAWLAHEETQIRIFETGGDIYTQLASLIFHQDITKLPDAERKRMRYLGKKGALSFNYGMAPTTFVDVCLLESDLVITPDEARRIHAGFFAAFPRIRIWHESLQGQLKKTRKLVTPWGRERLFHGWLNDDTYREAYSYVPQSTVVDALNTAWQSLDGARRHIDFQILQQGHDSLLIQVAEADLLALRAEIDRAFGAARFHIHGIERTIPWDVSIGPSWGEMKEVA